MNQDSSSGWQCENSRLFPGHIVLSLNCSTTPVLSVARRSKELTEFIIDLLQFGALLAHIKMLLDSTTSGHAHITA